MAELRRLDWIKELSAETLAAFEAAIDLVSFEAANVVIELDAELTHVCFVVTGRLTAELVDLLGRKVLEGTFERGSALNLFSIAQSDRSHMTVIAAEPTIVARLTLPALLELCAKYTDFQLATLRLGAKLVKRIVMVDRSLRQPAVVGIVHHSDASRPLTQKLARRLHDLCELPCLAGDDSRFGCEGEIPFRPLFRDGQFIDDREKDSILKEWANRGRLIIDIRSDHPFERLVNFLTYTETVLWCVRPEDAKQATQVLQQMAQRAPWLREKLHIVWMLDATMDVAPYVPELIELSRRDFKISFEPPRPTRGTLALHGAERIVHYLRGVQIGLALGGGAARGMAHLGVLQVLEEYGIHVDRIAGTSAGAMTGTVYASGMTPGYATQCFKTDLQPSWFFRHIPGGGYWYLLYKYRCNLFDSMLRRYLKRYRMEQLPIPMATVAVDLVEGEALIRESGDATHNILESINLAPLALPIFKSGQALVDGGLLNNVPANVLVSRGCNFVIASTVTAKLEKEFMGIRSKGRARLRPFFSTLQVAMRQNMIQGYNMNAVGVQPADFVIAPDVTRFDISQFTRADEMAMIGADTTRATMRELLKLLNRLDSKLFPLPDTR